MGAHDDFYLFKKPDSTSVTLLPCDPRAERVATSISYWQSKESTWLPADEKKLLIEYYELGSNVNKRGSFYTDIKFRKEGTGKYRLTSGSLDTMKTALDRKGEPYPRKDRTAIVDRSRSRSADGKKGKEKEQYRSASQLSTSNSAAGSGAQSGGIDPRVQTGFAGPSDSAGTTAGYDSYRPGPDFRADRRARGPIPYDNRGGNYGGGGSNDYRNFQDRSAGDLRADLNGWLYTSRDDYSLDYLYHSDGSYVHDSSFSGQGTYYYRRANGDLVRREIYQLYRY